ncbi:MAG: hypothetical protein QME74_09385 [Candidatus Edwardsbacteria bacterium]|nr:hypothetical protein [Candidatus Edwardsbacteria bacterium]
MEKLDQKQRVNESARMLSGSAITKTALKHARKMAALNLTAGKQETMNKQLEG